MDDDPSICPEIDLPGQTALSWNYLPWLSNDLCEHGNPLDQTYYMSLDSIEMLYPKQNQTNQGSRVGHICIQKVEESHIPFTDDIVGTAKLLPSCFNVC